MDKNPANGIKDLMWSFLMDKGQKENIPELKAAVYRLIKMTTQKTQRKEQNILGDDGHGADADRDRGDRPGIVRTAG
mgnify:CR=1 FL=1